jgi:hypothetical protein
MIDNVNLLVTSQKGAIVYATSPLAKMLGYPVKTLTTMQVRNLMPQPYSDLHAGWLKVSNQEPASDQLDQLQLHVIAPLVQPAWQEQAASALVVGGCSVGKVCAGALC